MSAGVRSPEPARLKANVATSPVRHAAAMIHPTRSRVLMRAMPDDTVWSASRASDGVVSASSISSRASAMSGSRRFGSFSRQRRSNRRTLDGVCSGSAFQCGSRSRIAAMVSDSVSPVNAARPDQHFVQDASEGPDVGAFVDGPTARLLGAHVGGGAQDHSRVRHCRYGQVGWLRHVGPSAEWFHHLREPEVEHLHCAIGHGP